MQGKPNLNKMQVFSGLADQDLIKRFDQIGKIGGYHRPAKK
jgi:hypothetical protein